MEPLLDPAHHGFRDDDFTPQFLRKSFHARGDVHRIADRRIVVPLGRTDVPDRHGAVVDADSDRQRGKRLPLEFLIERIERHQHGKRALHRLAARVLRLTRRAEEDHHSIADELVDRSVVAMDSMHHAVEIALQNSRDHLRGHILGKGCEVAHIAEEHAHFGELPAHSG